MENTNARTEKNNIKNNTTIKEKEQKIKNKNLIIGRTYEGIKFNRYKQGQAFVTVSCDDEIVGYGKDAIKIHTGLNIDTLFYTKERAHGKLIFTTYDKLENLIGLSSSYCFMRFVTIPDDAKIYVDYQNYVIDKFVLGDPIKLFDDEKICLDLLEKDGMILKHIDSQTKLMCCIAINQNPKAMKFVLDKTDDICNFAISKNGLNIRYVEHPTHEMCVNAVKQNPDALAHIDEDERDEAIYMTAIEKKGSTIRYMKRQNIKMATIALKNDGMALKYIKKKTPMLCHIAMRQNPSAEIYAMKEERDMDMKSHNRYFYNIFPQARKERQALLSNAK